MKNKRLKIAVTGGIGSGKSAAVNALKNAGYKVLSCDEENAKLLKSRAVLKKIREKFPNVVNGKIFLSLDKKTLSRKVFSSDMSRQELTDILHPLIMKRIFERAKRHNGVTFVEVPLLFETGLEKEFDGVIVVYADKKDRIERVKKRSDLKEEEIERRIAAQFDYDAMDKEKYYTVKNDKDIKTFEKEVLSLAEKLIQNL